jgi:hypothetical protein
MSCVLCLIPIFALGETARISGKSYSLMLSDALINMGGNQVKFIFTTYDGNRYTYPYYYNSQSGSIHYSREMKKVGNLYYADYYSFLDGAVDDYGEMSIDFGSIDSDRNGIDDICENDKNVNTNIIGNWYSHTGKSGSISGTMIKNINSQHGYFNLLIKNTWAGDIPATGDFYVGVLSGSVNYSKTNYSITTNYTVTFSTEWDSEPFQTTFNVIDNNTVRLIGKDFFPTTDFIRFGNKYSATVVLSDGNFDTFWPDYQKWYIEIDDTNDTDRDGIPNLSDTEDSRRRVNLPFLPLLLEFPVGN